MARKRPGAIDWQRPRLEGKTFVLAGKLADPPRKPISSVSSGSGPAKPTLAQVIEREKGTLLDKPNESVNYLILGSIQTKASQAIQQRVQRLNAKGASITLLNEQQLYDFFKPNPGETLAMLRAGPAGWKRWRELSGMPWEQYGRVDLQGMDLRDLSITWPANVDKLDLGGILWDGADLSGATITNAYINYIKTVRLDGANLEGTYLEYCEDCSFRKVILNRGHAGYMTRCHFGGAKFGVWSSFSGDILECSCKGIDLSRTRLNPANLWKSDFTRANMRVETSSFTVAHDAVFKDADFRGAELDESKFLRADLSRADLSEARLPRCDFTSANLTGAKLTGAELQNAIFTGADLRRADFTGANLANADFRGAVIDGADFKDANLVAAKLDGLDMSQAKNYQPRSARVPTVGPHIKQLEQVAQQSKQFAMGVDLDLSTGEVEVNVRTSGTLPHRLVYGGFVHHPQPNHSHYGSVPGNTVPLVMVNLARQWSGGTPRLSTVTVKASGSPLRKRDAVRLASAAWCEAFGVEVPSGDDLARQEEEERARLNRLQEEALKELLGGAEGVSKWNDRPEKEQRQVPSLQGQGFAGKILTGVRLIGQKLQGSTFDNANLHKATFQQCHLGGCTFRNADLSGGFLYRSNFSDADFNGARLHECHFNSSDLRGTSFREADLTKTDFTSSNLCGADFSEAKLTDVNWKYAFFDEATRFPDGFTISDDMFWKSDARDPRIEAKIAGLPEVGSLTFATFLERLNKDVEKARMDRALAMLKAERFQLFAEVAKDAVTGVVKSQSSPDLVYSCRLTQDGHYACCSQNLKPCGGLRGALCKHLLVLLIGLCTKGALKPTKVYPWIQKSRFRRPDLDGEVMSDALLKYKGAEAGEIDWRPTETIP